MASGSSATGSPATRTAIGCASGLPSCLERVAAKAGYGGDHGTALRRARQRQALAPAAAARPAATPTARVPMPRPL